MAVPDPPKILLPMQPDVSPKRYSDGLRLAEGDRRFACCQFGMVARDVLAWVQKWHPTAPLPQKGGVIRFGEQQLS
jgi:hypothetical protein